MPWPPEFLTLDEVLEIHRNQIELYGGADGVRDLGLLQSAIAQPQATFGGKFLHEDLVAMAAAYLFHLVQDHPFEDGNKRVGLASAVVFFEINGATLSENLDASDETGATELEQVVLGVASGSINKLTLTQFFRKYSKVTN